MEGWRFVKLVDKSQFCEFIGKVLVSRLTMKLGHIVAEKAGGKADVWIADNRCPLKRHPQLIDCGEETRTISNSILVRMRSIEPGRKI